MVTVLRDHGTQRSCFRSTAPGGGIDVAVWGSVLGSSGVAVTSPMPAVASTGGRQCGRDGAQMTVAKMSREDIRGDGHGSAAGCAGDDLEPLGEFVRAVVTVTIPSRPLRRLPSVGTPRCHWATTFAHEGHRIGVAGLDGRGAMHLTQRLIPTRPRGNGV